MVVKKKLHNNEEKNGSQKHCRNQTGRATNAWTQTRKHRDRRYRGFFCFKQKNPANYDMRREINSFHSLRKIASPSNSIHIHRITTSKQRVIFSLT